MTRRYRPAGLAIAIALVSFWPWTTSTAFGQAATAAAPSVREHVEALASAAFEGRLTGSTGARKAADYLVEQLRSVGALPLPGRSDLLVPFEFTAGVSDNGSSITWLGDRSETWSGPETVQALSFSDSAAFTGDAVFAGYGLVLPEGQAGGYDSYAGLDVEDKVVVVLRYFPEDAPPDLKTALSRYSGLRYKALAARERGARALIVVTGPRSPNAGLVVPMTFDTSIAGSGIVAASLSGDAAASLFESAGHRLADVQQELDTGNPHVAGFPLTGVRLRVETAVTRERQRGANVIAYLPGSDGGIAEAGFVMLGAHYDHLGRGGHGNSLARQDEAGKVHLGADDNASGVAAVLEAARLLGDLDHRRGVILAFWSGEELGLLGSGAFAAEPPIPIDLVAAYLNFDMVGRVRDNRLTVQAVGSSAGWPAVLERANIPVGFDLETQDDPYLPTDSTSFNAVEIPTLNFFSGSHPDYHRPTDVPSSVNYEDLARVARLGALVARQVANAEERLAFVKVEQTTAGAGDRATLRAFTGTIPDYTTEVEGLRLGGVIEGGPAAEAGLREGDVIVEFGGQTITNVYDYTYALDAVKIDEPVTVVYLRDGERHEASLTPRARR